MEDTIAFNQFYKRIPFSEYFMQCICDVTRVLVIICNCNYARFSKLVILRFLHRLKLRKRGNQLIHKRSVLTNSIGRCRPYVKIGSRGLGGVVGLTLPMAHTELPTVQRSWTSR